MSDDSYCSDDDLDDLCDDDYYGEGDPDFDEPEPETDPEYFDYRALCVADVEELLNVEVEKLTESIKVSPSLAKLLLHTNKWAQESIVERYKTNAEKLLQESRLRPKKPAQIAETSQRAFTCPICLEQCPPEQVGALNCNHRFCRCCWQHHFGTQIQQGLSTVMECMAHNCFIIAPEDFVNSILKDPLFRTKYHKFAFRDYVSSHPSLRFCPGPNCHVVVQAKTPQAKKVQCTECSTIFCFLCGNDYHSPTACDVIKQWLTKCADDSETANYISANTKDCPNCNVCIEKNGGCNHMQCFKCHHDFCWMCLGDWKSHGGEYYECSRYKENPNVVNESAHAQAREALKKYLFYFERWENHARSLKLEVETTKKIRDRIEHKVQDGEGTWIDWQYLLKASQLLRKCRYTLQYTYPYAYYMEKSARKDLFEYQQAQLEQEVENLSWKVERAQITDRGDLENQMDIAEKRRLTLLRDFLKG